MAENEVAPIPPPKKPKKKKSKKSKKKQKLEGGDKVEPTPSPAPPATAPPATAPPATAPPATAPPETAPAETADQTKEADTKDSSSRKKAGKKPKNKTKEILKMLKPLEEVEIEMLGIDKREYKFFQIIDMRVGRRVLLVCAPAPDQDVKFKNKYGKNLFYSWGSFDLFAQVDVFLKEDRPMGAIKHNVMYNKFLEPCFMAVPDFACCGPTLAMSFSIQSIADRQKVGYIRRNQDVVQMGFDVNMAVSMKAILLSMGFQIGVTRYGTADAVKNPVYTMKIYKEMPLTPDKVLAAEQAETEKKEAEIKRQEEEAKAAELAKTDALAKEVEEQNRILMKQKQEEEARKMAELERAGKEALRLVAAQESETIRQALAAEAEGKKRQRETDEREAAEALDRKQREEARRQAEEADMKKREKKAAKKKLEDEEKMDRRESALSNIKVIHSHVQPSWVWDDNFGGRRRTKPGQFSGQTIGYQSMQQRFGKMPQKPSSSMPPVEFPKQPSIPEHKMTKPGTVLPATAKEAVEQQARKGVTKMEASEAQASVKMSDAGRQEPSERRGTDATAAMGVSTVTRQGHDGTKGPESTVLTSTARKDHRQSVSVDMAGNNMPDSTTMSPKQAAGDNQRMRPSAWTEPNADPSKGPQLDPIKAGSSKVSVLTYGETIPRAASQPETTEPATTAAETKPTDDDDVKILYDHDRGPLESPSATMRGRDSRVGSDPMTDHEKGDIIEPLDSGEKIRPLVIKSPNKDNMRLVQSNRRMSASETGNSTVNVDRPSAVKAPLARIRKQSAPTYLASETRSSPVNSFSYPGNTPADSPDPNYNQTSRKTDYPTPQSTSPRSRSSVSPPSPRSGYVAPDITTPTPLANVESWVPELVAQDHNSDDNDCGDGTRWSVSGFLSPTSAQATTRRHTLQRSMRWSIVSTDNESFITAHQSSFRDEHRKVEQQRVDSIQVESPMIDQRHAPPAHVHVCVQPADDQPLQEGEAQSEPDQDENFPGQVEVADRRDEQATRTHSQADTRAQSNTPTHQSKRSSTNQFTYVKTTPRISPRPSQVPRYHVPRGISKVDSWRRLDRRSSSLSPRQNLAKCGGTVQKQPSKEALRSNKPQETKPARAQSLQVQPQTSPGHNDTLQIIASSPSNASGMNLQLEESKPEDEAVILSPSPWIEYT